MGDPDLLLAREVVASSLSNEAWPSFIAAVSAGKRDDNELVRIALAALQSQGEKPARSEGQSQGGGG